MAAPNGQSGQIPVIDLSGPEQTVATKLVNAAATYGFVYIKSLGKDIPVEAIDSIFALSKKFFSSPIEEKERCKIQENNRGWVGMHAETLDPKTQRMGDFKEAMNLGGFLDGKAQQPLPPVFKDHEPELYAFQKYCQTMMNKILDLFAVGLEVSSPTEGSKYFSNRHGPEPTPCTLRLLHYPPLPPNIEIQPKVDIRAGAHSDYGSITLLFQRPGQPGLEILPPSSTTPLEWTPVPVFPLGTEPDPSPPILVNIGDLLSYWTNNLFKSTVHRVVFPAGGKEAVEDRYSIAYFGHPIGETVLEAVPSEKMMALAGKGDSGVKAMTAHEHLMSRLKATYLGMYKGEGDEKEK
ncbi:oxidoreductase-like protein [Hyaloscypha sp. PMI_1271]|nr:oxidoreductase-like protein [Hyaloscypha sp. PMI_1271]